MSGHFVDHLLRSGPDSDHCPRAGRHLRVTGVLDQTCDKSCLHCFSLDFEQFFFGVHFDDNFALTRQLPQFHDGRVFNGLGVGMNLIIK